MPEELTGIQAMLARDSAKGGGGGGKRSATSALNAAHHVLVMAGRPLHGHSVSYHVQGLGLWRVLGIGFGQLSQQRSVIPDLHVFLLP